MNGFASRWIKLSINSLDRYASALGISVPAFPALSSAPWSPRTAESAPSQLKLSRRVSVSYLGCRENCGPFHICSIPPCWMKWDLPRHFVSLGKSGCENRGAQVLLEVADRGKGMPPEKQKAMASGSKLGVGIRGMGERVRQLRAT